jgi:hypothetical protein
MSNPEAVRTYLINEIDGLEPFELILVAPANRPLEVTEVTRNEDGGLEVRMPGRPPVVPQFDASVRRALCDLGFASEDPADSTRPWVRPVTDADSAADLIREVHVQVFAEKPGVKLNVMHGSHRLEIEAEEKIARARIRLDAILADILGRRPEQDEDGDYALPIGQVMVTVAPRALADGQMVVRVFAITNVDVQVSPELGLFLARLNFGLMFGRFALDTDHRSIWFDETLLGEEFREDELRFVVNMIATTADGWDDRLKQMFGGVTYQEILAGKTPQKLPPTKPGEGVGMYL